MDSQLINIIKLIIHNFENITSQTCYFLPTDNSALYDGEFSIADCPSACLKAEKLGWTPNCCKQIRYNLINKVMVQRKAVLNFCDLGLFEIAAPLFWEMDIIGVFFAVIHPRDLKDGVLKCRTHNMQDPGCDADTLYSGKNNILPTDEEIIYMVAKLLEDLISIYIKLMNINQDCKSSVAGPPVKKEEDAKESTSFAFSNWRALGLLPLSSFFDFYRDNPKIYREINTMLKSAFDLMYDYMQIGRITEARGLLISNLKPALWEVDLEMKKYSTIFFINICSDTFMQRPLPINEVFRLSFFAVSSINRSQNESQILAEVDNYFDNLTQLCQAAAAKRDPIVDRIIEYILSNYDQQFTISEMAKEMKISVAYASKLFKTRMGISIKTCITDVRLYHGQMLIQNTDLSISEIALKVGYPNVRSFYKIYNKYYHISCSELRNI